MELGRKVASGHVKDSGWLFKAYEAAQDATDAECSKQETWIAANPNYGYTVSVNQMRQSFERSKDDPSQWASFKQRRLNIWQRTSNPMLSYDAWLECAGEIPLEPKAVGGGAGLDLAASDDWAAFALAWDNEKTRDTHIWVRMWTSEGWIDEHGHREQFHKWIQDGWLQMHEGGAVDFEIIQDEIMAILKKSKTRQLGYDAKFGNQMSQYLRKRVPGCATHPFSQAVTAYAVGSKELINRTKNRTIVHMGNPALNWQCGHVKAKRLGDMVKPIKDDDNPHLKVDAVQAICMALDSKQYAAKVNKSPYMGTF